MSSTGFTTWYIIKIKHSLYIEWNVTPPLNEGQIAARIVYFW